MLSKNKSYQSEGLSVFRPDFLSGYGLQPFAITEIDSFVGEPYTNEVRVDITPGWTIDGMVHHHNNNEESFNIFSVSDLQTLYNLYQNGNIADPYDFVFAVVTKEGTYTLSISDTSQFEKFGATLMDKDGMRKAEEWYKTVDQNNAADSFAEFLKAKDSGLSLKIYDRETNTMKNVEWDSASKRFNTKPC